MSSSKFVKNLTSKDISLSQKTLKELISSASLEKFKELNENSEFIFPFLKERICSDFVKLLNKEDLKCTFEFSKVYSEDFTEMIVKSWLKFASEDLTDELLELFENGTDEQRAYCALYFSEIQDPLALEFLNKFARKEFSPLKINCAKALTSFQDETVLDEMIDETIKSTDEFEKIELYEFICAYKSKKALNFIMKTCFDCAFKESIILSLLDTYDFEYIKNNTDNEDIFRIFHVLQEGYPENISLNTICYYQIFDYIKYISQVDDGYAKSLILKVKKDFSEYLKNDIYNYDLDKNTKIELNEIVDFLDNTNIDFCKSELSKTKKPYRFSLALNVIKEYKIKDCLNILIDLINNLKIKDNLLAEAINTAISLEGINLIDKSITEKIENENIKAIILSYFN